MTTNSKKIQLIITLFFIIALVYLLKRLDLELVKQQVKDSNKIFLVFAFLPLIFTAALKIFKLKMVGKYYSQDISFRDSSIIQMVGISIATLTPARVGEGSKAVLLNKLLKVPLTSSVGIVVFERIFDLLFLSLVGFFFSVYILREKSFIIGAFFILLLIFLFTFIRYFNTFKRFLPRRFNGYFEKVEIKNQPFLILIISIATSLTWLFEAGIPWFLALSLNLHIPFLVVVGVLSISTFGVILSILPAGLGTYDLSFLFLFSLVGVSWEGALSMLLVYRLISVTWPFLLSILLINYFGLSIREIKDTLDKKT